MKSIGYYLIVLILKLKGIKNVFKKNPINFTKLREDDILFPKDIFFTHKNIETFNLSKSKITTIKQNEEKILLYIHGGAFISGPTKYHWDFIKRIAKNTDYSIWFCRYPKAPEHRILEISNEIDIVYNTIISKKKYQKIMLMGDSVGATLIITLTQRLIQHNRQYPNALILLSPILDASMTNEKIKYKEQSDPMLSEMGVKSAKELCAGNIDLKNPILSPIYGNFKNFPQTYLFIAENDITAPDQEIFYKKLINNKINTTLYFGKGMPHIWPLLPLMSESKKSFKDIISVLQNKKGII